MSVRVMTAVWDNFSGDEEEKFVLLAIADASNDEGKFVADAELIASKCSLSVEQTQEVLDRLIEAAWLVAEDGQDYRIALDLLQNGCVQREAT